MVVDLNGNVGLQFSYGTGVEGGAAGNASVYAGGYYATSMYSIEGFGLEEGVTGGEGAILGGGTWQACDENGNLLYYGGYGSLGLGGEATLFSAHVTMSNTHTLFSFNVFDLYEDIFGEEEKDTCCIAA